MNQKLVELKITDGADIYNMLQAIKAEEHLFHNEVYGMSYDQYKEWIVTQANWAHGINLPNGYVKQWIYWLYIDGRPVGFGKIREKVTENSRIIGGNIGYAISSKERGKGFGSLLFRLLLEKAKELKVEYILSTVEKTNPVSKRIHEKCGGLLIKENEDRWYFTFN